MWAPNTSVKFYQEKNKNIIIRPNHFKTGRDVFEEPWFMVKLVFITGAVLTVQGFYLYIISTKHFEGEKKKRWILNKMFPAN